MKKQWNKRQKIIASVVGIIFIMSIAGKVLWSTPSNTTTGEKIFEGSSDKVEKSEERRKQYIVQSIDVPQFRELYCETGNTATQASELIFEPCLWIVETGELSYGCAEKITFSQNGRKAIVELAERKFSDGSILEAPDVLASYERLCNAESAFPYKEKTWIIEGMKEFQSGRVQEVSGIRVIDKMHVEFTFTEAEIDVLDALSIPICKEVKREGGEIAYIGTGPYAVEHLQPSVELQLAQNPYCEKQLSWDFVIFQNMPLEIRDRKIKEQEVDELTLGEDQIQAIENLGYFTIYSRRQPVSSYVGFNLQQNNEALRKAVSNAIDRNTFVLSASQNVESWKGLISDRIAIKGNKNKAAKAYEKMVESGSDGNIRILSMEDSESRRYTLLLQEQLEACGMKITPIFVSRDEFLSMVSQGGGYDVYYFWNREVTNIELLKKMVKSGSEEYREILIEQLEDDCRNVYVSLEKYVVENALFLTMDVPVGYRAISADISENAISDIYM